MLEGILYFALGFLSAGLIALMVSPAVWNRAVTLTRKHIEASAPLTLNEIQADKDQLRAEFAMSTRRLEMSVEELRERASRQVIEINRKRDELTRLEQDSRDRVKAIGELESHGGELRAQLHDREEKLAAVTRQLEEARAELEEKALELERIQTEYSDVETESHGRRIELVAKQTEMDALSDNIGDLQRREREMRVEMGALTELNKRANRDLERERERNADFERRIERLERQLSEREESLERRERELARIRESNGSDEVDVAEIAEALMVEKSRNVELEARLAQSTLRMEALLNDASNDNVEKAMASLNRDKEMLAEELSRITSERDRLKTDLGHQMLNKSKDWEVERRENAILRERINDLAAQVTAMAAALEGDQSAIDQALAAASESMSRQRASKPADTREDDRPASLADRIRALQQSARQNKAG